MITKLDVELKILIYIIAYGIYYFASSDVLIYIINKIKKKIVVIIFEVLYLIIQIYITYNFCYKLENGYIPIYFMLFIVIGFLLYFLFMREYFNKCLDFICIFINKSKPIFAHLFFSKTIFKKPNIKFFKKSSKKKSKHLTLKP